MAHPTSTAAFPGIDTMYGVEITVSRGVTPAVALVSMLPQDHLALAPGPLTLQAGSQSVTFPDCAPVLPSLRMAPGGAGLRWTMLVKDHRWRWEHGSISGEWNRRLPNGTVDLATMRTPASLAAMCLNAMGEFSFDTSQMPEGVFPYVLWNGINPALALQALCDKVGCVITGGEFAFVTIHRRGQGQDLPPGGDPIHEPYRFAAPAKPRTLVVQGGPFICQSKLELIPVGREVNGDVLPIDELSYTPGWEDEHPWIFASVTNAQDLAATGDSVLRWYRPVGQAGGGMQVPGAIANVTSISQLLPLGNRLLDTGEDPDGMERNLPAFVEGEFFPYSDAIDDTDEGTRYIGPWELVSDNGLVIFPVPVFSLDEDGVVIMPLLYLTTTYRVRLTNGQGYASLQRQALLGGSAGDLVLHRPELFASFKQEYSPGSPTSPGGVTSTLPQAIAEADAYLAIFAGVFTGREIDDREYAGIEPVVLDGHRAQYRIKLAAHLPPTTRASTVLEFDIYAPPEQERRAIELARHLREVAQL